MKNNPSIIKRQEKNNKIAYYKSIICILSKKRRKVLNQIIKYLNRYRIVNPAQATIADHADVSLSTVHRGCLESEQLKLLTLIRGKDLDQTPLLLPHIYQLNEDLMDIEIRNALSDLLSALKVIPIMLILSAFDVGILKGDYKKDCDIVTNVTKKEKTKRSLNEYRERWGEVHHEMSHYGGERPPSKSFTSTWQDMLPAIDYVRKQNEKEKRMEFSAEELQQLTQFSKETIEYAQRVYNLDVQRGKQISNPFSYFHGICTRYKPNPSTGRSAVQAQSKALPSSVQNDESPLEASLKYEMEFHENESRNAIVWRMQRSFSNPFIKLLTEEEQQRVMGVHKECRCRQNGDNSLKRMGHIVTKPHDLEKSPVFPVYGVKTNHQPPESQLPPQPMDSFDEQYTPLVDAMYEGYEECLD